MSVAPSMFDAITVRHRWPICPLEKVVTFLGGGTPSKQRSDFWDGDIPWVSPKDMKSEVVNESIDNITPAAVGGSAVKIVPAGALLVVVRSGILARTVPIALAGVQLTISQDLKALVPASGLDAQFLAYFMRSAENRLIAAVSRGATVHRLETDALKSLTIPLPPLDEQKRVVAVLDQAFAALDRARALAVANLSDAQELLDNTLLVTFDELLSTAAMITLSDAADDFSRGKSRHRPRNDPKLYGGDYPFIQTGDIRRSEGSIREYSQTYNEAGLAQSKLWPVGTVCITIAANIAETGVLEFEGCFPDSVIGMVPNPGRANAYYVEYMLRYFAKELKLQGKGSAQDNINLATFENAKFPFPPIEQQAAVVDKLDSVATEVAGLRANYHQQLADLATLRQSLLQKAFSGQLT